jgi:hypothetical protein
MNWPNEVILVAVMASSVSEVVRNEDHSVADNFGPPRSEKEMKQLECKTSWPLLWSTARAPSIPCQFDVPAS